MPNERLSSTMDVGINLNARPNAVDIRGQQPNLFPTDAFEFDDPNRTDEPVLSMKPPWSIDVGEINFTSFDADTQEAIRTAYIRSEENRLMISNTEGTVQLEADILDLIARELNLEGDTITITADKLVIFNPSDEDETETLDQVLKIEGGDIYFGDYENGAGMKWDQDAETFMIKGTLEAVDGIFSGDLGADIVSAKKIYARHYESSGAGFYILTGPSTITSKMTSSGITTNLLEADRIEGGRLVPSRTLINSGSTQNAIYDAVAGALATYGLSGSSGYYSCAGSIERSSDGLIFPITWFYYQAGSYVRFQLTTTTTLQCNNGSGSGINYAFILGF